MPKTQLLSLSARSFGVIEDATIFFGDGFNVVTGETGAGKTLLLGALQLCLGLDGPGRTAVSDATRVAAVFERDDHEIVLQRESQAGRLRSFENGLATSAEALRILGGDLIDLHGQHDSLTLRSRSIVLSLIDETGAVDTGPYARALHVHQELLEQQIRLGGNQEVVSQQREYLRSVVDEIDALAVIDTDEIEISLRELEGLDAIRDSLVSLSELSTVLGGDEDVCAVSLLGVARRLIPSGESFDELRSVVSSAIDTTESALVLVRNLIDPDAVDGGRIATLEARIGLLREASRKFGGSLAEMLRVRDISLTELEQLEADQAVRSTLASSLEASTHALDIVARKLRSDREFAAVQLTDRVREQLARVALPHATLRFVVDGDDGSQAHIMFSPNPGRPEAPLADAASGGELSRVLLAVSLVVSHGDHVAVFDEIDAGVGGEVAQQIGECLAELGANQQVIAITHLATVAAKAQHHYLIEKKVVDRRTETTVREIQGAERVGEIARMLAGGTDDVEARALAVRLLTSQ